jgi:hypothetical protein
MAIIDLGIKNNKLSPQSLNEVREKGKYFLTLTLVNNSKVYKLPNEPLISLSQSKKIIETPTLGYKNLEHLNAELKTKNPNHKPLKNRTGTVKELIQIEDYNLTIRGVCVNEIDKDVYPTDQVQMLNELANINAPLLVKNSKFLEVYNIRQIVIKDIHFDEMQGKQGLQTYLINAVSNQDFYADLKEKEQK